MPDDVEKRFCFKCGHWEGIHNPSCEAVGCNCAGFSHMPEPEKKICGYCVHWRQYMTGKPEGQCRRHAPRPIFIDRRKGGDADWPGTRGDDWCGEWSACKEPVDYVVHPHKKECTPIMCVLECWHYVEKEQPDPKKEVKGSDDVE